MDGGMCWRVNGGKEKLGGSEELENAVVQDSPHRGWELY